MESTRGPETTRFGTGETVKHPAVESATTAISDTQSLLDQERRLAEGKQTRIKALLKERDDLFKRPEARAKEIAGELKTLGYKVARPRKAKDQPAAETATK
jgi:hypothetical protein